MYSPWALQNHPGEQIRACMGAPTYYIGKKKIKKNQPWANKVEIKWKREKYKEKHVALFLGY